MLQTVDFAPTFSIINGVIGRFDGFLVVMFARIFHRCWIGLNVFGIFIFTAVPLWAAEEAAEEETQVWVLSYAIMTAFLALALLILLRPTKREDTAFSFDELQAQKEEEMKKIKGTH